MWALLSPELVMLFAWGKWASAQRSVADMHSLGYQNWTMIHAFYADMGGFPLHPPDFISLPITANRVQYLVMRTLSISAKNHQGRDLG